MKYLTRVSAGIKFWHPTALSDAVQSALNMRATSAHSVGELRTRGDFSEFRDTYCFFEIVPWKEEDVSIVVNACADALSDRLIAVGKLIDSGGEVYIAVKISTKVIQVSLERHLIIKLGIVRAGVTFEFCDD